jgi:hypothetical protein
MFYNHSRRNDFEDFKGPADVLESSFDAKLLTKSYLKTFFEQRIPGVNGGSMFKNSGIIKVYKPIIKQLSLTFPGPRNMSLFTDIQAPG